MATTLSYNDVTNHGEDLFDVNHQDKFFSRLLIVLLVLYLLFGLLVPSFETKEIPRAVKEQAPVQLTRVLLQEKEKEPPPPEVVEEEPKPEEPIKTKRQAAKAKAQSSGLAAMKDDLFALRDAFVTPSNEGGLVKGKAMQEKVTSKLLAAKADAKSETIAAAEVIKTADSGDLTKRDTQTVRLAEEEVLLDGDDQGVEVDERLANERSEIKLRQTLEANKSRLYSLYNRALRKNPFLKGKVMFAIEIQPSGKVSAVSIESSELEDPALEKRLLRILRSINFGAEDVDVMTTVWAVEFLPR